MFGGSTRGNFYHSLGLAIVAHATGTVSYCEDKCLEIGTIAPVGPNEVKIHNADSYDWDKWWVRFFVANVVNGAVTVCEVQRDKKERLSGSCKDLVTASMGGPTVNDQKK